MEINPLGICNNLWQKIKYINYKIIIDCPIYDAPSAPSPSPPPPSKYKQLEKVMEIFSAEMWLYLKLSKEIWFAFVEFAMNLLSFMHKSIVNFSAEIPEFFSEKLFCKY